LSKNVNLQVLRNALTFCTTNDGNHINTVHCKINLPFHFHDKNSIMLRVQLYTLYEHSVYFYCMQGRIQKPRTARTPPHVPSLYFRFIFKCKPEKSKVLKQTERRLKKK